MSSLPLHPMVVHIPIALAVLTPLLAALVLLFWWRRKLPRGAWALVLLAQVLLVGGAWAAIETGEREEERVEEIVGESRLEAHEEAAEVFIGAAGGVLALTLLALVVPGETVRRVVALVAVAGMVAVAYLGFRVGEAGGELVYRHGAALAYTGDAGGAASGASRGLERDWREREEHERYEHEDDD